MGCLICDDLITPIEQALSKDKIENIFSDSDFVSKGKIFKFGFTLNAKDCPYCNRELREE